MSYYNRRILNLQLPGHHRLYPRQEPGDGGDNAAPFDTSLGELPTRRQQEPQRESELAARGQVNSVRAPPPAYRGTGAGLPLSRTVSSGATLVSTSGGSRRSRVCKVAWAYHPSLSGPHQLRDRLYRYLWRKQEALSLDFPPEFNELLLAGSAKEQDILKIQELWQARISHLNDWIIPDRLAVTRQWLAVLEIIDIVIVILFIVALAVTQGRLEGLLQGAAVALIMVILLSAGFVNQVRIRRWQLQSTLRNLSRDWSPLPTTSSTATDLVQAYIGNPRENEDAENSGAALRAQAEEDGLKPVMRWGMYTIEGSFWTSWRPVVNVELIVPGTALAPALSRLQQQAQQDQTTTAMRAEDWVPTYTARQAEGERVVQFSA